MSNKNMDEEKVERIVGNTVATEAFEYMTIPDREVEELKRLARGNISIEEYLRSGCGEEGNKP